MSIGVRKKVCTMCKQAKPLTDFHQEAQHPDGRRPACAECTNARTRERNEKKRVLGEYPHRKRDERLTFAGYPRCRSCEVVMLPDGDIGNQPSAGDVTTCEDCARKRKG